VSECLTTLGHTGPDFIAHTRGTVKWQHRLQQMAHCKCNV